MYSIYIKNYANAQGTYTTSETLLYSIPIIDPENALLDPIVKTEMGKTGSFEFRVHPDHPYFNCWRQMQTIMRVVYDGTTLFRGRVLTIDNTLFGDRKIHCEGDLAFLMDSYQPESKEEKRSSITILAYLTQIINNHNAQMQEDGTTDKVIQLGNVPGSYSSSISSDQKVKPESSWKYGSNSMETSMNALEALVKEYGGYLRTRYSSGTCYLDWLDNWFNGTVNGQPIEIGENMIDLNSSAEVDNIFTALIPIGSKESEPVYIDGYKTSVHGSNNRRILVPQIVSEFTDSQLSKGYHSKSDYQNAVNRYGIIYKTEKFQNADTQAKLWEYACDYILNNYIGGLTGFTLTALDMHHIDGVVQKYLCGDKVRVRYPDLDNRTESETPIIQKTLTVISIQYNLHNPEKNNYNIGIPNNILQRKYGTAAPKSKGGGGGGSGIKAAKQEEVEEDLIKALDDDKSDLGVLAWSYVINEKYNNVEYQQLLEDDPKLRYAPAVLKMSKNIVKEILDPNQGHLQKVADSIIIGNGKIEMNPELNNIGVLNPQFIQAGKTIDSIVINAYDHNIEIRQKYVTGTVLPDINNPLKKVFEVSANPFASKLKMWEKDHLPEDPNPVLSAMLNGEDGTISNIISVLGLDGSGEKATIFQNGLTAMLQFFTPTSASTLNPTESVQLDGALGTGKVGKDSNNGWQVQLNNTVTYIDSGGHSQTASGFVTAKDFNIPEVASFKTKLVVTDNLIAGKATIQELNAAVARIETLETDSLRTNDLYAAIANLTQVNIQALTFASATSSRGGISVSSVATTSFSQGGVDCYFPGGVKSVTLSGPSNNVYTLTTTTYGGSSNSYTFSRAITSASWEWSGGCAKVTLSPQDQDYTSPAVDNYTLTGSPSYDSSTKYISQNANIIDSNGDNITAFRLSINASLAYTAGYNAGVGEFTQQTITLQGTPTSSLTLQGTQHKVTPISSTSLRLGNAVTVYKRSSDQFTVQGIGWGKLHDYGWATLYTKSGETYSSAGNHHWYYASDSGTQLYYGGTTTKYEAVSNGTARFVQSSGGTVYYTAGTELTLYNAGTNVGILYNAGTISTDYYTRSSS